MYRKSNESALEYKMRVIDPISSTYCGAKWYNATIWLGSGQTASCHHPPPHKISLTEIQDDPSALHNTFHKKVMRAQMLKGERPKECEYCWKIENLKTDSVSDRVHKSEMFSDLDHLAIKSKNWNEKSILRNLEIAFDRSCQFACSYCNSGYSTAWSQDIDRNGPYQNLRSDGAGAYWHNGAWSDEFTKTGQNPYVDAFWKWWPELSQTLEEFRITGGEPLMSKHLWKLLDLFEENKPTDNMLFSINSNLGVSSQVIDRLLAKTKSIHKFGIYTSCEATKDQAEYIRDGLNYKQYCQNLIQILETKKLFRVQLMITVNSLALYGLTDWLDQLMEWKDIYGKSFPAFGLTILRFPSFMSPSTLPKNLREERALHIESWYNKNKMSPLLMPHEKDTIERLVEYLREVEDPHHKASDLTLRQSDFKMFYQQYDTRRNKNFAQTFPKILVEWYNSIPTFESKTVQNPIVGNASDGYHPNEQLKNITERLGLT